MERVGGVQLQAGVPDIHSEARIGLEMIYRLCAGCGHRDVNFSQCDYLNKAVMSAV